MYKQITYSISRKSVLLAVYLFAILFLALYGRYGFQTLNQVILWGFGPILAFYVLEPNIGRLHKIPKEYYLYLSMVVFALMGYVNVVRDDLFFRYLQVFIANFVLMIIVYFAINNIREWEFVWKFIFLVGCIVAISSYFVENTLPSTDEYYRLAGITGNANGTATYARVATASALILLQFTRRQFSRIFLWGIIIFLGYTVILTASRGNFVNYIFLVGGYFAFKYFSGWRLVILLLILFLFGNLMLYFSEQFLSNFYIFKRFTRNESVEAAIDQEARLQLYAQAWSFFVQYPLLGVGLGQFYYSAEGKITHTDVLDILVQLGIFAGMVYVAIYVRVFRKILRLRKMVASTKDLRIYQIVLLFFISEIIFGFSNPNWFTQLEMVVLSMFIVYVTKIRTTNPFPQKKL